MTASQKFMLVAAFPGVTAEDKLAALDGLVQIERARQEIIEQAYKECVEAVQRHCGHEWESGIGGGDKCKHCGKVMA